MSAGRWKMAIQNNIISYVTKSLYTFEYKGGRKQNSWKESRWKRTYIVMIYEITFPRFTEYLDVGSYNPCLGNEGKVDICFMVQCWSLTHRFFYARRKYIL